MYRAYFAHKLLHKLFWLKAQLRMGRWGCVYPDHKTLLEPYDM